MVGHRVVGGAERDDSAVRGHRGALAVVSGMVTPAHADARRVVLGPVAQPHRHYRASLGVHVGEGDESADSDGEPTFGIGRPWIFGDKPGRTGGAVTDIDLKRARPAAAQPLSHLSRKQIPVSGSRCASHDRRRQRKVAVVLRGASYGIGRPYGSVRSALS